jgi:hypothetical protein
MNTDCLTSAAEYLPSNVSNSRFSVFKKLSAQALSQQFPFSPHALANRRTEFAHHITKAFRAILYPPVRVE